MKIMIISGPNLNLLGKREPEIYGNRGLDEMIKELQKDFPGQTIEHYQSNMEGELVSKIQETGFTYDGIIINAGAYTHTSVALADAIGAITTPVIEVHLSNIFSREDYRHVSYLGARCKGSISGFGIDSYRLAMHYFIAQKS